MPEKSPKSLASMASLPHMLLDNSKQIGPSFCPAIRTPTNPICRATVGLYLSCVSLDGSDVPPNEWAFYLVMLVSGAPLVRRHNFIASASYQCTVSHVHMALASKAIIREYACVFEHNPFQRLEQMKNMCVLVCVYVCVCVCVCVCVFIKLHITTQSGPVILVILCHSH